MIEIRALRRPYSYRAKMETTMKKKVALIFAATILSLVGCKQSQDQVPEPTAAQQQVAFAAYDQLRDGEYEQFLTQLEPELQQYFQDNQRVMKKFSKSIPKDAERSRTLMTKKIEQQANQGKQYKISYEIAYPKNLVQYDVSFDAVANSATTTQQPKIRNLNIQVFGE